MSTDNSSPEKDRYGQVKLPPTGIPANGFKQGRFYAEEVKQLDGTTKVVIRSSNGTFTYDLWEPFLEAYKEHGLIKKAAASVGVSAGAVKRVLMKEPVFAEACVEAEEIYRDKVVQHVQNLVFNGQEKKTYDRNGNLISEETVYPIPLIQMEARRVEEGYRDKKDVNMNVSGGVLVAPAEVASIEDWSKRFGDGEVIEGETQEVTD